jgi:gamma-glutamyltranspeptidase/glutathione hydrolase
MLVAFGNRAMQSWDPESLEYLARVQRAVLSFRRDTLDLADNIALETARLLELVRTGQLAGLSASTVHTSAVDDDGLACSITASSGYGSGEMPQGTGLWLNNCLGELELNRRDPGSLSAGDRLPSNMAPTVARSARTVLCIGTPGADRITTALHQFLVNFLLLDLRLDEAILHPRMHAEIRNDGTHLAVEPGLAFTAGEGFSVTRFPERAMYFGGVAAALFNEDGGFDVAADPRREGATFVSS